MGKRFVLTFLAFIFVSSGFIQPAYCAEKPPILIASIFAHTGEAAEQNSPNYLMTRLAALVTNEKGGVLGRRLKLVEIDNKSTAIGSHQAALKAIEAGVVAVVGPSWSSHALAMAPIFQEARIPMIGATTSAPEVTQVGDFIFRACYTNRTQAQALAQLAIGKLHASKAALMVIAGDAYSEDLANQFESEYAKLGGVTIQKERYLLSAMDFEKQLLSIRQSKPDVIVVPGFARDSGLILKQAWSMGIRVPFLGGDGWTALELYPHIGKIAGNNYYVSHWHPENKTPANQEFLRHVRTYLGPDAMKSIDAGNPVAYDAMGLIIDAIKRAQSTDPIAIRDALSQTTNFPGVTGNISFNESRDPQKPLVVLKISGNRVQYEQTIYPK